MDPAIHPGALSITRLSAAPRTTWRTASGAAPSRPPSLLSLVIGRLRRLRGRWRRTSASRMAGTLDLD